MQLNQFVMGEMLRNCGLETVFAKNGEEALKISGEQQFDVILLDIVMPIMDGLEACRRIRALNHHNSLVPIVALTANVFDSDLKDYAKAGITATLVKPVEQEQLFKFLHSLLNAEAEKNAVPEKEDKTNGTGIRIDLSYLNSIGKGNEDFVRTMMESFSKTVESLIVKLTDAILKKNTLVIGDLLHQLKFPLGVVGLNELNQQITTLELNAKKIQFSEEENLFFAEISELLAVIVQLKDQAKLLLNENAI